MTNEKTKADYFIPENAQPEKQKEKFSPSGKYKLVITPYRTPPGGWGYTQGLVYNVASGKLIAEVQQNYCSFPFLWVEGHATGHEFLICHEDYQGQTVIELDTGLRKDFLPEAAKKGHGFCWAAYTWNKAQQMLAVEGCFWACPYEHCFYDFSDPMNSGWPEIKLADERECIYCDDGVPVVVKDDGTIIASEKRIWWEEDEEYNGDENGDDIIKIVATNTYKREGLELKLIDAWVDPEEVIRRAKQKAGNDAWKAAFELYQQTNPMYLMVMAAFEDKSNGFVKGEYSVSTGVCYDGWCPHFKEKDNRVCVDLCRFLKINGHEYNIEVEWGRETAPIKLHAYVDKKALPDQWFERDQMPEALAAAKAILKEKDGLLDKIKDFVKNPFVLVD